MPVFIAASTSYPPPSDPFPWPPRPLPHRHPHIAPQRPAPLASCPPRPSSLATPTCSGGRPFLPQPGPTPSPRTPSEHHRLAPSHRARPAEGADTHSQLPFPSATECSSSKAARVPDCKVWRVLRPVKRPREWEALTARRLPAGTW